jgi:predicted nucleic acid-binding protein
MPSLDEKVICHALALKEQEYNLDMCDCVILAHAIVDENAQRLFTFDRTLVTSRNIKEYVKNNNPNLKITDSI